MKTDSHAEGKAVKASRKRLIEKGSSGVCKQTKKTNKNPQQGRGQNKELLERQDKNRSPAKDSGESYSELSLLIETTGNVPVIDLYTRQPLLPLEKIKLQLFPVNEVTRMRLVKDGHNPYLELILRARKKISSVIRHLDCKWGSSSIALGEPMLLPYNAVEQISSCKRWTLNDCKITAADVHAAIGRPPIFRLRYGWLSRYDLGTCITPGLFPIDDCLSSGGIQGYDNNVEAKFDNEAKVDVASEICKTINAYKATDNKCKTINAYKATDNKVADLNIGAADADPPQDNNARNTSDVGQLSKLFIDGSTNISIGGLLSEASLMGKLSNYDSKTYERDVSSQPNQIISDSLDAFFANQASSSQSLKLRSENLCSSILDADETCHGFFPLQNISPIGAEEATPERFHSTACSKDGDQTSNLPKSKDIPDVYDLRTHVSVILSKSQGGTEQALTFQDSGMGRLLDLRTNDERSLGLKDIEWLAESLGPLV